MGMHVFSSVFIGSLHMQVSLTHHPLLEAILHIQSPKTALTIL